MFCENLEEGGLAVAVCFVDVDDEGTFFGLRCIESGEDFLDKEICGGVTTVFVFGSGLIGVEGICVRSVE